ncbi:hypothetical protein ASA1KI_07870 [Opitutales bacterium ASA1]|uniref:hypothetical protein n=1 Tax=Congregicoccus parvus TaxID=3081749 RepID=UPI002B2BFC13|nr:hypothetical protein ASA1KI_07870 [Opitutales bacterium ASA1]
MNTKTKTRLIKGALAFAAVAAAVVLGRLGGELANSIPPEALVSLVAIAGLFGLGLLDLRSAAPRGLNHGLPRRFQRDFVKTRSSVVPLWRNDDRAAA